MPHMMQIILWVRIALTGRFPGQSINNHPLHRAEVGSLTSSRGECASNGHTPAFATAKGPLNRPPIASTEVEGFACLDYVLISLHFDRIPFTLNSLFARQMVGVAAEVVPEA